MGFTTVAQVADIPAGKAKQVTVNGKTLAVFNSNGAFYAIDNECPHRGGPLAEGELSGTEVECPWHGARFNIGTGAHLCPPANRDVTAYKVQVIGQEVQVDA
ncbi:MAG TPA: non-heme iron oxygenase ferredoxin subunit [Gemmataceae bacterium]|nr:non-heme iron oxygenase ferredoxin subunit [Gemmataceae bacterium]